MAKAKSAPKQKPAKKAPRAKRAAPAKAAKPARGGPGAKRTEPATKPVDAKQAAPRGGDGEAKKLIEIATEVLPSDQVKTCAAALAVYALAQAGKLSPAVTLEVWRAGTCFNHPTSQKATKGQQKLLIAAGFPNPHTFVVDNARRWIAAGNYEDADELKSVAGLMINNLLDLDQIDAATAEFKRWTPHIVTAGRAGKLPQQDWIDGWFGTYIWKIGLAGRKDEEARATKLRDAEKARG